ncbi:hypothetical protein CLOBOL_01490 [Enterocloster bolteae ATCC BAA-613]|uniref:Uncharacterized protein n=1 Tax=Enterocloster bolteae (strain ATCC BAA-613 / DSM 15670 / CCUG 46953 / JCM 12243 / WAL 16351) TaxID=411902 RepID=A8RL29_ENTBW|nr:hypothetical protein CLOBOL_01490 [Enterocloster bolteae ATCC BAA-613]
MLNYNEHRPLSQYTDCLYRKKQTGRKSDRKNLFAAEARWTVLICKKE